MGGRRVAGSHCLQGWRAGPSPPPLEGVDHSPEGDGGNGAPMPRLGLGSVPLDKPLLPLDQFVQRSKGPRWSSAAPLVLCCSATSFVSGSSGLGALHQVWIDNRTMHICNAGDYLSFKICKHSSQLVYIRMIDSGHETYFGGCHWAF